MNFISNRELSITIWGIIFILFCCRTYSVRVAMMNVIRAFFKIKVLLSVAIMLVYILLCTFLLYKLNLWNVTLVKDSCISAIIMFTYFCRIIKDARYVDFRIIILENLKISIFTTFLLNYYSLPFWIEMIFVPIIFIAISMIAFIDKQNDSENYTTKKLLKNILLWSNYYLVLFFIIKTIANPSDLMDVNNVRALFLPLLLTIFFLPFLYLASIYSIYEQSFVILKCLTRSDMNAYKFRKNLMIKKCGLNLKKLNYVKSNWRPALCNTNDEFKRELEAVCKHTKINYFEENN